MVNRIFTRQTCVWAVVNDEIQDAKSSDVNKDWTCKDKDRDQAYKDQDKDKD